ncbi:MAG: 3-methyl-2-oxobutanoate hydroxymethyltransferase [Bdellovibrio sp.]|nr:MAG: 3-methyl-2-oxobutanoate hydroxymethyltransferase [Bdellovibrio sp.]
MKVHHFLEKKEKHEKIAMITCYESWAAVIVEQTEVDAVLVGDSVAMVMYGDDTTLNASTELIARHVRAVASRSKNKFIVGDLPFLSYRLDLRSNVVAAGELMKAGAHAVKLEGARGNLELIRHLVDSGIPVMGHLGLTPQSVHQLGGYRVQGRGAEEAERLHVECLDLEKAGCFSVVLECVPAELAKDISQALKIPTIGIGAGAGTDGQILVWHDFLGLQTEMKPKFVRRYLSGADLVREALGKYVRDVKSSQFPNGEESFQ